MMKRVANLIQCGLLSVLLVYGLIVNWGIPKIYTFLSVVVLGVVLGLLFLIYGIEEWEYRRRFGVHIGLSALAILLVALFNQWIVIDWTRVFMVILILAGLALLGYLAYYYYKNQDQSPKTSNISEVEAGGYQSPVPGQVTYTDDLEEDLNSGTTNEEVATDFDDSSLKNVEHAGESKAFDWNVLKFWNRKEDKKAEEESQSQDIQAHDDELDEVMDDSQEPDRQDDQVEDHRLEGNISDLDQDKDYIYQTEEKSSAHVLAYDDKEANEEEASSSKD
ncbi:DUF3021 family protein [Facklamia hominis]|uniref:Uncharacterized protein n=1 Tax=Facklamia hominis CCUG 36813 TaxID=883111 RepID=K1MFM6_9LACT|nr:DUF3021 family protein [Facklamia hominis]EKB54764.1 hypothetical protein HMPREF9706_00954 [Facklamia hominis CCUG 36813]